MTNKAFVLALMTGSSLLCVTAPAFAQDPAMTPSGATIPEDPAFEPEPEVVLSPEESSAKAAFLEAQVDSLQQQIDELKASLTKVTPSWKGAPQYEDKDAGWSFKPRGRLQWDDSWIENPNDALVTRNLGFNTRARRIRLGLRQILQRHRLLLAERLAELRDVEELRARDLGRARHRWPDRLRDAAGLLLLRLDAIGFRLRFLLGALGAALSTTDHEAERSYDDEMSPHDQAVLTRSPDDSRSGRLAAPLRRRRSCGRVPGKRP